MSLANLRAECEQLERDGKFRRAATQWLELSDLLVIRREWAASALAVQASIRCSAALMARRAQGEP